ncbi:MAG: peptidylprolyl isomerase [Salinivirgaceae bacterium]|nr:peptidylprolyl isomerase [Salinivirgaceae bacterium]
MRFVFILLFFIAVAGACSSPTDQTSSTEKSEKKVEKESKSPVRKAKKKKKPRYPELSNKNVKSFLTKYGKENRETIVVLKTTKGDIKIRLYKQTPLHRANFVMLAKRGFYDETVFYRVEKDFIIQGGDSDDYDRRTIKRNVGYYSLPAEMNPAELYHKPGAVSMARDYEDNPDMRSSSYDFFIVLGTKYNKYDLDQIEKDNNITFSPGRRQFYETVGGAAHLDKMHTVFGEVISGMDVVNTIAEVEVDGKAWPKKDISMTVEVIK